LRDRLDALGRRLGGSYRVLVDANQHVHREGAARPGVGVYGKNTMLITRRHGSWVVLATLVTHVAAETGPRPALARASSSRTNDRLYVPRNEPRYLKRNALVALGNTGTEEHLPLLERYADDDDELLREHATWAIERIRSRR